MKPVILFVDDEVDLVQVLVDAVSHAIPSHDVWMATSAQEAADCVALAERDNRTLALIVCDHSLGRSTGLEFLEGLRKAHPDVPAILFTGQAPASIAERAAKVGAKVLWKPVRLKDLLAAVRTTVGA